jgi:hypothetical protein
MPDPLLFALGALVTTVVGLAVWSVGLMDVDGDTRQASKSRDTGEEDR